MQYWLELEPCPLCIFQRFALITFLFFSGLGVTLYQRACYFRAQLMSCITALVGLGLASRQVWLQHLGSKTVSACGPSLEVLWEFFPIHEVIWHVVKGSGSCAEVDWSFLGLSLAAYSALLFLVLLVASGYLTYKAFSHKT